MRFIRLLDFAIILFLVAYGIDAASTYIAMAFFGAREGNPNFAAFLNANPNHVIILMIAAMSILVVFRQFMAIGVPRISKALNYSNESEFLKPSNYFILCIDAILFYLTALELPAIFNNFGVIGAMV